MRAGLGGLDQRPLDDPGDLGAEPGVGQHRGDRRAERLDHRGEASGDVAAGGLVGQARVVDRLDELGGEPPLLLEKAVGGRGLPFEVALGIGLLPRQLLLDAAREAVLPEAGPGGG